MFVVFFFGFVFGRNVAVLKLPVFNTKFYRFSHKESKYLYSIRIWSYSKEVWHILSLWSRCQLNDIHPCLILIMPFILYSNIVLYNNKILVNTHSRSLRAIQISKKGSRRRCWNNRRVEISYCIFFFSFKKVSSSFKRYYCTRRHAL